jgi:hypothetical protein
MPYLTANPRSRALQGLWRSSAASRVLIISAYFYLHCILRRAIIARTLADSTVKSILGPMEHPARRSRSETVTPHNRPGAEMSPNGSDVQAVRLRGVRRPVESKLPVLTLGSSGSVASFLSLHGQVSPA